jgi:D-alanyl-D-alanine carboxypeptidase/D-alanyl-D-alanine-endopeptidase (penicillin-binding protein 4)
VTDFFNTFELNSGGLFMEDGSGLSRYNSITLDNQIDFLEYMFETTDFDVYLNSLAEGGKTGTIKKMFQNTKSVYRLKSGTLSRVKGYSGYVINQKGDTLAISFIINNYSGSSTVMKKKMEELIINLCE